MLSDETRTLVAVLGRVDSLWWPSRDQFELCREQVLAERRREYATAGIEFVSSGTGAERQRAGRQLESLRAADALDVFSEAGRRVGVRLTPRADAAVRQLCGVFTVAEAWPLLKHAAELDAEFDGDWWPEHLPVADEWDGSAEQNDSLKMMRQQLIPLLPAGYVEAAGDGAFPRRYWLRLTEAGRDALAAGPPADAPDDLEADQTAADLYDAEWDAYAAELAAAEPERPQDLVLPVPCGVGWGSRAALEKIRDEAAERA